MSGITDMTKEQNEQAMERLGPWAKHCVLHVYRGSVAHGMYVPSTDPLSIDDIDTMAIVIPPLSYYYGLRIFGSDGTKEIMDPPWDIVMYEFRKLVSLLQKGNPNVLSILWLEDKYCISISPEGAALRENRRLFVGKHVYQPFVGYAHAQMKRMLNGAFRGYMGEKRKALVEKFGYDTKNACHMIRLMIMCVEFLRTGELLVTRPDAAALLDIKHGKYTLDQVKEMSDELFAKAEEAHRQSTLPEKPDYAEIEKLLVRTIYNRHTFAPWPLEIR